MIETAFTVYLWINGAFGVVLICLAFFAPTKFNSLMRVTTSVPDSLVVGSGLLVFGFPIARLIYCASYALFVSADPAARAAFSIMASFIAVAMLDVHARQSVER